jgi:hypothetical protein
MRGLALQVISCLWARWHIWVCLSGLVTLHATSALGAGTEPIRIEYRAASAAGCPSEGEFESKVFARTASARPAADDEPARTFIVELRHAGGRTTGSLVIQEKDGATMARRVNGAACADVATVLALATALAIDPRAELAPGQTLEEAPQPEPASDWEEPSAALAPEPPSSDYPWVAHWSLGATAAFAVAPSPAFGASLMFSAKRRRSPPLGEAGLELVYRQTRPEVVREARALFRFFAVRPNLCVTGVELGSSVMAAPCLVMEAGGVTGVGSDIPNSAQRTRFWATVEALLRLDLAVGDTEFITLEGGAAVPLTRYRFVFRNPDTPIHEVPAVSATVALRFGTSF